MRSSEYEKLKNEIFTLIIGAARNIPDQTEEILRIFLLFEKQLQAQLQTQYKNAHIGIKQAVEQTVSEAMTYGKLPSSDDVDLHSVKGILERTRDQISDNLNHLLEKHAALKQEASADNRSRFTRGPSGGQG